VTGSSRVTNQKYLSVKAQNKDTTVEEFLQYYVCKDALRQLKAGRTATEIRQDYPNAPDNAISSEWVKESLKLNGKSGPSGPHKPTPVAAPQIKQISPEVEKLVETVRDKETVVAEQ
jgi:hypothetical protein